MIGWLAEAGGTPPPAHNNFGDTLSDGVAGPTALLIIVLLAIATVLLIRNMNGRLRRLPAEFPAPAAHGSPVRAASGPAPGADGGTSAGSKVRPAVDGTTPVGGPVDDPPGSSGS